VNAAHQFFDRIRNLGQGRQVTGRQMASRGFLSVSIGTQPNVKAGWGLGFHPSWELRKSHAAILTSDQLKLAGANGREAWNFAQRTVDQIDEKVLQDLILDSESGMLRAILSDELELRALGADPGEERAWYVRDLETQWLLTGSKDGLRLTPYA
jgi:hypothetical protein